jgi:hypothetical protein
MECNVSPEIRIAISSMHAKRNTMKALYRGWELASATAPVRLDIISCMTGHVACRNN